ncbi:MAG: MobA/MobL family protein, partial [Steroidobacteraceae bacterium]
HELNQAQQIALLRAFAAEIANRYHVAVDFALHKPHRKGDARNFHAHVYSTTREITPTGLGPKAAPELSDTDRFKRGLPAGREEIKFMRARFAEIQNEHLRVHGIKARVDHRTLEAQGIDRMPTTHLGVAVWGMERRGIETRVGLRVREQQALEAQRRLERAAELGRLEREGREVTRSMLDLSADLSRALRERDRGLERAPEASAGLVPGLESEGKALPAADRLRAKADQVAQRLALEREQGRPERETAERERELARQLEREKQKQQELERDRDLGLER